MVAGRAGLGVSGRPQVSAKAGILPPFDLILSLLDGRSAQVSGVRSLPRRHHLAGPPAETVGEAVHRQHIAEEGRQRAPHIQSSVDG